MAKSPSRRKTNVPTSESLVDQPVTIEYTSRGKRVRKECDDAIAAKRLFVQKDRAGLNPKIIKPKAKEPVLVAAVSYTRKSTKGKFSDGRERQETSLERQRESIEALAERDGYRIIRRYEDAGISGNNRGAKRPDFHQMLIDARERQDFQVILVDSFSRFTRVSWRKATIDENAFVEAGVTTIVSAQEGVRNIADETDLGEAVMSVATKALNHKFLEDMAHTTLEGQIIRVKEFKRSGAPVPYGMAGIYVMEKDRRKLTSLKLGNRKHVAIVKRIYERFTHPSCPSLNGIVSDLNREGIPSPQGKQWSVAGIRDLMMRPVYKGAFAYGRTQRGKHRVANEDAKVVKRPNGKLPWRYRDPIVLEEGVYPAIVSPRVWDAAQKRLAILSLKGNRRQRVDGYPLAGILICGKCKRAMYGCQPTGRNYRVYRCITPTRRGMGTCGTFEIHEEEILPVVWKMLVETMEGGPEKLRPTPPNSSDQDRKDDRAEFNATLDDLKRKIDLSENNLLACEDERNLKPLELKLTKLRDEYERLSSELDQKEDTDYQQEEWEALEQWFADYYQKCVRVPVEGVKPDSEYYFSNVAVTEHTKKGTILWSDNGRKLKKQEVQALVDPRAINDMLHAAGTEVRLWWRTREVTLSNGKKKDRHAFRYGTFKLGQQTGRLVERDGVILSKVRFGTPCHDAL